MMESFQSLPNLKKTASFNDWLIEVENTLFIEFGAEDKGNLIVKRKLAAPTLKFSDLIKRNGNLLVIKIIVHLYHNLDCFQHVLISYLDCDSKCKKRPMD